MSSSFIGSGTYGADYLRWSSRTGHYRTSPTGRTALPNCERFERLLPQLLISSQNFIVVGGASIVVKATLVARPFLWVAFRCRTTGVAKRNESIHYNLMQYSPFSIICLRPLPIRSVSLATPSRSSWPGVTTPM